MKINISVDIDEIIENILKNEQLFEFMLDELSKRNNTIINKDDIEKSDDDNIKEPNMCITISPIKKRRGRPRREKQMILDPL